MNAKAKIIYDQLKVPFEDDIRSDEALKLYAEHREIYERAQEAWEKHFKGSFVGETQLEQRNINNLLDTMRKEAKVMSDILAYGDYSWGEKAD